MSPHSKIEKESIFWSNFKVNQAKYITYKYPLVYVSYNELFKMHFYIKIKMLS